MPVGMCRGHACQRHSSNRISASAKHPATVQASEELISLWLLGKETGWSLLHEGDPVARAAWLLGLSLSGMCKRGKECEWTKLLLFGHVSVKAMSVCVHSMGAFLLILIFSLSSQNDFPTRMSLVVWSCCGHVMLRGWTPWGDCSGKDLEQQARQASVNLCSHQPWTLFQLFVSSGEQTLL